MSGGESGTMTTTIIALGVFFVIAFLPKVPWFAKIFLQLALGGIIYFVFSETMFDLPMGDSLPISSLFGGDGGMGEFNKLSMGVVGTVLGMLGTLVATILYKLLGKNSADED